MRGYFFSNGLFVVPPDINNTRLSSSDGVIRDSESLDVREAITEVIFENGITNIPEKSFNKCVRLSRITFPNTLRIIGRDAFSYCSNLTKVEIPEGITVIEWCLFQHCTSLKRACVPSSVSAIQGCAFLGCSSLEDVNIPKGVKKILSGTFQGCKSLTHIEIPYGVEIIEEDAFVSSGIVRFDLPSSISEIGFGGLGGDSAHAYGPTAYAYIPSNSPFVKNSPEKIESGASHFFTGAIIHIIETVECPQCKGTQIATESKHELFSLRKFLIFFVLGLVAAFTGDIAALFLSVIVGFLGRSVTMYKCKRCNFVWQKPSISFSKESFVQWWKEL